MKRQKNMMAKVVAFIALFAIVIGVIGTWLLVVFSPWDEVEITPEELQQYIDSLSWSSVSWTGEELNISDINLEIE